MDTTIVVAAHKPLGEWRFTAAVVQAAEDLLGDDQNFALEKAHLVFFKAGTPWFSSLGLAKQFASLLARNLREKGTLENANRLIIEIAMTKVYRLSRKGSRVDVDEEDTFPLEDWSDPFKGLRRYL